MQGLNPSEIMQLSKEEKINYFNNNVIPEWIIANRNNLKNQLELDYNLDLKSKTNSSKSIKTNKKYEGAYIHASAPSTRIQITRQNINKLLTKFINTFKELILFMIAIIEFLIIIKLISI